LGPKRIAPVAYSRDVWRVIDLGGFFSVRFLADDIRRALRRWAPSPDLPGLVDEVPAGVPMDHPLFPVLWPREGLRWGLQLSIRYTYPGGRDGLHPAGS
jgi:hypothetical protein